MPRPLSAKAYFAGRSRIAAGPARLDTRCGSVHETERRRPMSLISLLLTLVVVGVLLWLLNNYVPMDGKIKSIINALVVIVVVVWLLQSFGVLGSLHNIRIG
jgi:ABC-type long-subunit fatty acid transport system fused permease/ATPase subunit